MVQVIINYHWSKTRFIFYMTQVIPFSCLISLYFYFNNFILEYKESHSLVVEAVIMMLFAYFFLVELKQISKKGPRYFLSATNLIEIFPIIAFPLNIAFCMDNPTYNAPYPMFYKVSAVISLSLWFKFLYLMRSFSSTAILIRSLIEAFKAMKVVIVVLLVLTMAFSDVFYDANNAQLLEPDFAGQSFIQSNKPDVVDYQS